MHYAVYLIYFVHKIHVKLTFICSDLGARYESSQVWSPPLIFLVTDPEPRAGSQPSCFSPASLCSTDWPVVSLPFPIRLPHTDNYSSEPALIFLLWEQGSTFIQTKNTAVSGIKCRHCGNPGLAVSTWLNKKWREPRQWSTSCCRVQSDLLSYRSVRIFQIL